MGSLFLVTDLNSDGHITGDAELRILTEAEIVSFDASSTGLQPDHDHMAPGVTFFGETTVTFDDGTVAEAAGVGFRADDHTKRYLGDTTVSEDAATLAANLKGFGHARRHTCGGHRHHHHGHDGT